MVLEFVDDMLVVSEEEICEAISWLLAEERLVVEGAGAVGAAALLSKRVTVGSGDRVNVVISGGNIDYDTLRPLLHD
jgi:threonine dehydratase